MREDNRTMERLHSSVAENRGSIFHLNYKVGCIPMHLIWKNFRIRKARVLTPQFLGEAGQVLR